MKKFGKRVCLFCLVSFILGIGLVTVWRYRLLLYSRVNPIPVTICELNQDPIRYSGVVIRVKANMYAEFDRVYLHQQGCPIPRDTDPRLDISDSQVIGLELNSWVRGLSATGPAGDNLQAVITVTGKFDETYKQPMGPGDDHFSGQQYRIISYKLEQNAPISRRF